MCCSRYCEILFFYGWQSYWFKPCIIRTTYWCRIEFSKYWSRPKSCHKKLHLPDTCLGFWCLRSPCEAVWMHLCFFFSIWYLRLCNLASIIRCYSYEDDRAIGFNMPIYWCPIGMFEQTWITLSNITPSQHLLLSMWCPCEAIWMHSFVLPLYLTPSYVYFD